MYKIKEFLKSLDLTEKETDCYVSLLELGEQPASIIAKKIVQPRSSTAVQLETLVEKGFAKKYTKNNANYYSPVKPDDLKSLLERRRKKIDHQLLDLTNLAPEFRNIVSQFIPESKVLYFEGVEGVCKMIDIMTQKDTPLYFMSAHKFHPEIDQYVKEVYIPRRKKMKTKCQMIMTSHDKSKKYAKVNPQVYEWVGFIPSNTYPLESTIVIYDDVVQFQACCGENPSGVLIENAYLAKTMLAVFMLLRNAGRVVKHSL